MLYPSSADWQSWGITAEHHKLFVLVWAELFGEDTPDTWQTRTSNIRTILAELLEVLTVSEHHDRYRHNIPSLLAEALQIVGQDPIALSEFPFIRPYLETVSKKQSAKANDASTDTAPAHAVASNKDIAALRHQVQVMLGHLTTYRAKLVASLRRLLEAGASKENDRLSKLTLALATDLASIGHSTLHLRESLSVVLDPSEPIFAKRFDRLIRCCQGEPSEYLCRFAVSWPKAIATGQAFGSVELTIGRPLGPLSVAEATFYGQSTPDDVFADVRVDAMDPISARTAGEAKLSRAFAILNLYQILTRVDIKGHFALVTPAGSAPALQSSDESRRAYLRNMSDVPNRVGTLIRLTTRLQPEDTDQLLSALQYHRLALSAADDGRLVNLWIALESLTRRGPSSSIIDNVCRFVAPSLAVNNLHKLVLALAIYLAPLTKRAPKKDVDAIFFQPPRFRKHELLKILLEEKSGPRITALIELVKDHPLLRYRIFRLWDEVFRSPRKVADNIEHHRRDVEWQLRRIYRERNNVMHRGRSTHAARHLLQHLHVYLVFTINNLVHDLRLNPTWTLPDALEHRRLLCDHFVTALRGDSAYGIRQAALLDPALILFGSDTSSLAWTKPPASTSTAAPSGTNAVTPRPTSK
jgi:hypothetical protein